ncbi:hypothetical protein [Paludisphaera mucosa]|uniref:Uncharacterized protein n=1 Tax=Paludisphaera mucosa TaxID=3030827 RepID=A0ABT6FJM4_9BACT|nr:hypothetical protein [Paludisphaera mucosa]MDG3007585.1 hypothetical protein [Paludisphaera mucosa]
MPGWIPPCVFAWIAKPVMDAGWLAYLCRRHRVARVLGLVTALFAQFTCHLPAPGEIFVGYFLWHAGTLALTACAYLAADETRGGRLARPPI